MPTTHSSSDRRRRAAGPAARSGTPARPARRQARSPARACSASSTAWPGRTSSEPGVVSAIGMSAMPDSVALKLVHHLEIERHDDGEADLHAHRERGRRGAPAHHRIVEHGERQERLGARAQAASRTAATARTRPRSGRGSAATASVARAAPGQRQQQRDRRRHHQDGAEHVELVAAVVARDALEMDVGEQRRAERRAAR